MTKQRLSGSNLMLVGFTLFSMFFGAGNLIFPPFLAAQAGKLAWPAMGGFLVSAVGLPVLGVAAVALSGGLPKLAGRVGTGFAVAFTLLAYLSIGPCLAIPRTASTSFEMTVLPLMAEFGTQLEGQAAGFGTETAIRFGYSVVFFLVAMLLAHHPERLTDCLGKILCPTLLILIGVLFAGCLIWPVGSVGSAEAAYSANPAVKGFLEGYQTMDAIAALVFGIVIVLNIQERGVKRESDLVRETVKAGVVAGLLLTSVYCVLAYIGMPVGRRAGEGANGARILTYVAGNLFGTAGKMILGVIFLIACLNTCIGLLSSCGQYFATLVPRVSYGIWVLLFALASLAIACAGLDRILSVSVPILNAMYPVAIVLMLLGLMDKAFGGRRAVYRLSVLFTGLASVAYALEPIGLLPQALGRAAAMLPGYEAGLGWVIPAVVGAAAGLALQYFIERQI